MQSMIDETLGKTILLDSFRVELRIAASLGPEVQRDILAQLDESSFGRRLLPNIMRTLHDAKMQQIQVALVR